MITLFTISKTELLIVTKNTIKLHNENEAAKVISWYIHRAFKGFFLASINRSDRSMAIHGIPSPLRNNKD